MARQRPTPNRGDSNFGWVWPMWAGPRGGEEVMLKQNCGWAWSMWAGRPRIDRIVIRDVQYQFEVNRCRNEEVNLQGSSAYSRGGDSGQYGRTDGPTDGQTAEITTISPLFS
ncbi:hypothetical protein DPMN_183594 [Dreissena polymorpha]|uniref:Uncharacterized protein n=1 Tax=Dreissena polymorpha TaxID=45954 RepID=A0A9D4DHM6_DREPO|nr:hypothetical protein DPMN_183594 [Dreissena polymorpha]